MKDRVYCCKCKREIHAQRNIDYMDYCKPCFSNLTEEEKDGILNSLLVPQICEPLTETDSFIQDVKDILESKNIFDPKKKGLCKTTLDIESVLGDYNDGLTPEESAEKIIRQITDYLPYI